MDELFGKWQFNDIFSDPNTLIVLRSYLRRVLNVHKDNDIVVETLDSVAHELVNVLFVADKANLNPDDKIKETEYGNRIGKLKSTYPKIYQSANYIHDLRTNDVQGPHPRNASGSIPSGINDADRKHCEYAFGQLFKEIVKALVAIKATEEE